MFGDQAATSTVTIVSAAEPERSSGSSRRRLLGITAATAFLVGFHVPICARGQAAEGSAFVPNAFIKIDDQGDVTLIMPQVEMGQGTYTAIPMILAEELDADWSRVKLEHAPPDEKHYVNPMLSIQATGNSNSVRAFWTPLRLAGAGARAMLIQAAAAELDVPVAALRTRDSQVIHDASGRKLAYAALARRAATLTAPANPTLKDPKDFRLIGKPVKRLDTPGETNGTARYGIDALPPGVKFATLAASPVLGGKVVRVDDAAAKAISGVRQVVILDDLVAVIGDHMWAARSGLEAMAITWDDGPNGLVSSDEIWDRLRKASTRAGSVAKERGDPDGTLGSGEVVNQTYEMPLLAHACMEPMNCTVHVTADAAEVWIGTQVIERVRQAVAKAANLPEDKVTVHNHLLGGGFGRRLEPDMAFSAARIAAQVEGPVKVVWTREEDIRHDIYRPAYHDMLSARLDGDRIVGWKHKISGSAVMARFLPAFFNHGVDPDGVDSAQDVPYDIPNVRVAFNREEPPGVVTGFWRGVGPNNNVFAIESFIDELAVKARKDPIAFRRAHLSTTPRPQAALDLVREKSGWDRRLGSRIDGEAPGGIGGIGETGATAAIPALRNAIYAATGVALRRMPIDRALLAKETRT